MDNLLRPLSARPELVVDATAPALSPLGNESSQIGNTGPLGRHRVVSALPLNRNAGSVQLRPPLVLRDHRNGVIADPSGNVIGRDGVWVHRMLSAAKTIDTRRL